MSLSDILLKLVVDSGDSNNKLHEITNEINNLKASVKEGNGILSIFANAFKDNIKEAFNFDTSLKNLQGTTNNYDNTVNKINNSQKTINKTFEEGSQNIDKIQNTTKNYTNTVHTLETSIKGGVQALNSNNTAIQGNIKEINTQTTAINAETTAVKSNTTAVNTANTSIQAQNVYIRQTIKEQKDATESSLSLRNIIWELTYAWRGLVEGVKLIIGISFTEWSREFEKNMYNMQSIALESIENFNYLKNSIIQISKENNYSGLIGLSDALYQAYSSGFKMADALDLVKEADRGALAGLANTKDVLEALVTVMHSYGMSTDQASKVNDIFLKTVQDGVITMPQLSRYIGQATTIAPELGIALEDVAGGFVAMTRQGLNAAESTTALNAVMNTFLKPSKQALDYAKELGINLSASAFEGKNFAEVIVDIAKKSDVDVMGKVFGNIRGLKGFFKLAKDDGDKFIQYIEGIKNATGAVDKAIAEQRKSFDQSVTQLKNTWEIFMQNIGESIQQFLTPLIQVLISLLKVVNEFPQALKDVITGLILAGEILSGLIITTFSFNQGMKALGSTVTAQKIIIDALSASYLRLEASAILAKTGLGFLGGAMTGLLSVAAALSAYKIGEGIATVVNLKDDLQGAKDRVQSYYGDQKNAQTKVDLYKNKTNLGVSLTNAEKQDYAQALVQADPKNKQNKELAIKLGNEYNLEVANHQKIADAKTKMDKETAEKNIEIRKKYDNEKTQGSIDNLIFEATHSEYEIKLNKKAKEYDEKINLLREHAKLPNNVSPEESQKDLEQAKALEIAKEKELAKLRKEYAEKELERKKSELARVSKMEYDAKQYDIKLKGQNYQENVSKLQLAKGAISEDQYEIKMNQIEAKRKSIFDEISGNKKLTQNVRDDAELKSLESSIKLESNLRKVKEETIKKDYDAIKEKNSLELNSISHLAQMGKITKEQAITSEIEQLNVFKLAMSELVKTLPKGSKSITEVKKEIEKVNLEISNKKDEKDKDAFEKDIFLEQTKNQKIADDNETLYQLKQKNQEDYLKVKVGLIDAEIEIEQTKYDQANKDEKVKIQANIDKLRNSKKKAEYEVEKLPEDIEKKYQKQIFDDEKKQINELKNLKIAGDLFVYRSSLDNINKYLAFLKTQKQKLEDNNEGSGGSIGGKLGTQEWQDNNNLIKSLEAEKLQIVFDTDQKIIDDDKKLFEQKMQNLNLYSLAFEKVSNVLLKSNNSFVSAIGESLKLLNRSYNDSTNFIKNAEPLISKINQNDKSTNALSWIIPKNVDQINSNADDNATQQEKIKNLGIGLAIEKVSESLEKASNAWEKSTSSAKKYTNVLKTFSSDSKQVKEAQEGMIESQEEWLKAIPALGGVFYSLTRAVTDFFGATKSEESKKETKELSSAYISLAKTKLNVDQVNLENKISLLDLETEAEREKAVDSITSEEALKTELFRINLEYNYKKNQLEEEFAQKSKDIQINLNKALRGLATESYQAKLEDITNDAEKQLNDIAKKYNISPDAKDYSKSRNQLDEERTVRINQKNSINRLNQDANKEALDIESEYQKSLIELQDDSLSKTLTLLNIEKNAKINALNYENLTAKWTKEEYNKKYLAILNEYQKDENKAILDNSNKIRDLNDKNYNLELKAIETLYGKKTQKVKTELDNQLQIIDDYNKKVLTLTESRQEDQALKTKRANAFQNDLISTKNRTANSGLFSQSNWENFDIGNGITQGNESERQKVENDFNKGLISFEERSKKRQQLALEKYVYYENQLANFSDPEKRKLINQKITDASSEYYDFIFDKEKEKLDIENANAIKKRDALKLELKEKEEAEAAEIKKLDSAYKTSSGIYKDTFVNATRDWIEFARKETIEKLGVDSFTAISQVGNNLVKNQTEAQKLQTIPSNQTGINNSALVNNTSANFSNDLSMQDKISAIEKKYGLSVADPNAQNNTAFVAELQKLYSTTPNNNQSIAPTVSTPVNPSGVSDIVFTPQEIQQKINDSGDLALRQKILENIYSKFGTSGGIYDSGYKLSTPDLIKLAQSQGIPLMAKGGVTRPGQPVIAGENGIEHIFTETDALKIHNELRNPSSINNNNSAKTIIISFGDNIISGIKMDDTSKIKEMLKENNEMIFNKISNSIYSS